MAIHIFMRRSWLKILVFLLAVGEIAHAQTTDPKNGEATLDSLKLEFDIRRAELKKPLDELQQYYEEQLKGLMDVASKAGKLENAIAIKAELENFRDGKSTPAEPELSELRRLQEIYAKTHAERAASMNVQLRPVLQQYRSQLLSLQKRLTQEQKFEKALMIKEAVAEVDELEVIRAAAVKPSGISIALFKTEGEFRDFKEGEVAFRNRGYRWTKVPRKFSEWEVLFRPGGAPSKIRFEILTPGLVYLLVEKPDLDLFTKLGWEKIAPCSTSNSKDIFIMEQQLKQGEYLLECTTFLRTRLLRPKPDEG